MDKIKGKMLDHKDINNNINDAISSSEEEIDEEKYNDIIGNRDFTKL